MLSFIPNFFFNVAMAAKWKWTLMGFFLLSLEARLGFNNKWPLYTLYYLLSRLHHNHDCDKNFVYQYSGAGQLTTIIIAGNFGEH